MAYLKLFFFTVAFLSFMLISPSYSSLDYGHIKNLSSAKNNDDDKVTLSLYYETLCPYSASFITDDLVKVFQNDLDTIVNLRLVPWGNAHIVDNRIHCQHGEKECYLNTIHSCVINLWPDVKTHFEFIRCTEEPPLDMGPVKTEEEEEPLKLWVPCSEKLKLNEDLIKECYISGSGNKLDLQYAYETANLHPPHVFVPWVVVNNQPIRGDFENFVKYVCQAYKGGQLPKACKAQSSSVSSTNEKAKAIYPGCYAGGFRRHGNEIEP